MQLNIEKDKFILDLADNEIDEGSDHALQNFFAGFLERHRKQEVKPGPVDEMGIPPKEQQTPPERTDAAFVPPYVQKLRKLKDLDANIKAKQSLETPAEASGRKRKTWHDSTIRDDQGRKHCSKCDQWKPETMFYLKPGAKDGYATCCKECISLANVKYHPSVKTHRKNHVEITAKHCQKCNEIKPISEFNKSNADRTGYQSNCRECQKKMRREWKQKHSTIKPEKQPASEPEKAPGTHHKPQEPQTTPRAEDTAPISPTPIKTIKEKKRFPSDIKRANKIIMENFKELGIQGIYSKNLLPGFSLTEIRQCCIDLKLLDQYGNLAGA